MWHLTQQMLESGVSALRSNSNSLTPEITIDERLWNAICLAWMLDDG